MSMRIRSYVRREGRITKSQKRALQELWSKYGLELSSKHLYPSQSNFSSVAHHLAFISERSSIGKTQNRTTIPTLFLNQNVQVSTQSGALQRENSIAMGINFSDIFGRSAPIVFDIGFGMGGSLLEMAKNNPDNDYIGVEVFRPGIGSLMLGLEREGLNNVRLFCVDAVEVLQHVIADSSLSRVLIFFPDPWHKKRHHKRRLIQPEFVELVAAKLIVGGVLHLATDWQDYADYILQVISASKSFVNSVDSLEAYRPTTKFEQRGKRLGHDVWDLVFRRT